MLNVEAATTKLNAIKNKNAKKLAEDKVYLPFLGDSYTEQQAQEWLDTRAEVLEKLLSEKEADTKTETLTLIQEVNAKYPSMTADVKPTLTSLKDYNEFCRCFLVNFAYDFNLNEVVSK